MTVRLLTVRVYYTYLALLASGILIITSGCDDDSGPGTDFTQSRLDIAETLAEDFIAPGFTSLRENAVQLRDAVNDFVSTPDDTGLVLAQERLRLTRLTWQSVATFQFGPTGDVAMRREFNTYPVDESKIQDNIDSGDYTLGSVGNVGAEGFPALGYMLHGIAEGNDQIVDLYVNDAVGKHGAYLTALAERVLTVCTVVENAWSPSSGNYVAVFTSESAAGTDVGSALSLVVNAYEFHLQRFLRDGKIGIPAGVRSAGIPRPESVEAFYAGYSTDLLDTALEEMKNIYTGESGPNNNGYSLEDYLVTLGREDLAGEISLQFDEVIEMAATLNDPLNTEIENDEQGAVDVFLEIQKLVPLIKSDMASARGVIITNQDADGD